MDRGQTRPCEIPARIISVDSCVTSRQASRWSGPWNASRDIARPQHPGGASAHRPDRAGAAERGPEGVGTRGVSRSSQSRGGSSARQISWRSGLSAATSVGIASRSSHASAMSPSLHFRLGNRSWNDAMSLGRPLISSTLLGTHWTKTDRRWRPSRGSASPDPYGCRLPLTNIGGVSTHQYEHALKPLPADDTAHCRASQASLHSRYTPSTTTILVVENLLSSSLMSA